MKKLKNIGGSILTVLLFIASTPWFASALIGSIVGGFFQSFYNGFKKGVTGVDNFTFRFQTIQLENKMKQNQKKDASINA